MKSGSHYGKRFEGKQGFERRKMRSVVTGLAAALGIILAGTLTAAENPAGATVRADRPRVMLTPERIEALKEKVKTQAVPGREPGANALKYVLTGDEEALAAAVDYMRRFDVGEDVLKNGTASDDYRWAYWVPVIYDWCNGKLTDEEKKAFVERYGRIAEAMNGKSWGGPQMPGNNYYAGYMRNSAVFALAAWGETPLAESLLRNALATRWESSSLPYYDDGAKGGVIGEGSQYDRYNIQYVVFLAEALRAATGRDIMKETNWFREWTYQTIYSTTPTLTYAMGVEDPYFQRFAYGDCEMWEGHPGVDEYIGDSMRATALLYADEKVGGHAQAYLDAVEPAEGLLGYVVEDGREVEPGDLSELPLDYYAPGAAYAFARSKWSEDATAVMLQLGVPEECDHNHLDAGSFQMVRADRWMTKESTGYATQFNGCTSRDARAHNTILVNGRGQANAYPDGQPEILAIQTSRDFFHAAVDLTKAYRASKSSHPDRDDNPVVVKCIREFIYIRPDVLIIFDRLETSDPEAEKTFVLHFPTKPKYEKDDPFGVTYTSENGGSQFVSHTVYPENVEYKLIDESDVEGKKAAPGFYQWRLETNQKGTKESYFLTVVAGLMRFDLPPNCELVEKDDGIGAIIKQPGRKCEVYLKKALGESLGRLVIDAAGAYGHSESDLPQKVQTIGVDANGVHWGEGLERAWPVEPVRRR